MALRRVTDSDKEPVSLEDAKDYVRVTSDADNVVLSSMIRGAREWVETATNRIAVDQTWRLTLDDFPAGDEIRLGKSPVNGSTNVTLQYQRSTAAGTTSYTTFSSTNYIVDTESEPGRVVLKDHEQWPTDVLANANAVRVEFVAGYGSPNDVPERYKDAVKLAMANRYEHREPVITGSIATELPLALNSIIWSLKVPELP